MQLKTTVIFRGSSTTAPTYSWQLRWKGMQH